MNNENKQQPDFVIGRHPAMASLKSGHSINKVFIQEGLKSESIGQIIAKAKKQGLVIQRVSKSKLDTLANGQNHQGVVLAVASFEYASLEQVFELAESRNEAPFVVILDGIEDPHNLGSILRTVDAAGVHGVIIPKRRAVGLTSTVAKTSAGAIERVPVVQVNNLVNTLKELKDRGLWIFGTDMAGTDYRRWDATGPVGLIIGNEGKGMARLTKENVDEMLTIPMVGDIQSLNASVAAGLLIYQGYSSRHPL
ncbi:23S rRNA (guanosine(2251)-2'-O)-methyltransferase RlmB [Pediococcus acidilactici]|uniref:23S rRNA (Guanosine(2251)-2'-O)-methyltransferase RlmB n=1 Tax=Pediococcus acidilactici TaxID=1254 RepID=A0AAW8YN26_PEDAC|nr:23S rRNA (guanosine(2251)-2'-O)-methyltransferase RlmB [Pediococcus acidilactici]MDV2911238.1 23S rRNA (guanosine(2251)-2'-O)-methyltransferase RlmB [Pediococcus acidilactici]WQS18450.1 23S rRNA (guanosine(2251)-2'-O)-methyltransferase RlmB [Pediococcus acidilactici]